MMRPRSATAGGGAPGEWRPQCVVLSTRLLDGQAVLRPAVHATFQVFDLESVALEGAGGDVTAVTAGADGDDRLVPRKRCEAALEVHERDVLGAADVAVAPFGGLAHVEHMNAALCELLGESGRIDAGGSAEEAHDSGLGRVLDHCAELLAHLLGDGCESVVLDD